MHMSTITLLIALVLSQIGGAVQPIRPVSPAPIKWSCEMHAWNVYKNCVRTFVHEGEELANLEQMRCDWLLDNHLCYCSILEDGIEVSEAACFLEFEEWTHDRLD